MDESKLELISEPERTSFRQLIVRCENANIAYEIQKIGWTTREISHYLEISLPSGREKRDIQIWDKEDAEKLVKVEFEKYVFIQGYQSICSYRDSSIEAYIAVLAPVIRRRIEVLFSKLLNISYDELKKIEKTDLAFEVKHQVADEDPVIITISQPTNTMLLLTGRELDEGSGLTIKIAGLKISTNQEAAAILEKLANSLFFQIESSTRVPLMLETYHERPLVFPSLVKSRKKAAPPPVRFPKYEYDRDPLNLYWYAKSAYGTPLPRFLAYYQVLEFYFPTYARKEANKAVANIVKDPAFNPDQDVQVGKIVSAVVSKMGRGYGEEKQQLRATIQECVEDKEIREFLEERDYIKEYFKSDFKKLSPIKINIGNKDLDLREQLAERLYDIRCKIVHTKAGETLEERILPFTEEAALLPVETDIIEFIARKVIIAGSRTLSI